MVIFRTTILLLLLAAVTAHSQTYITGGEVTGNWTPEGSPYIVEGDMTVAAEERLAIEAGVEVLFTGPFVIEVYGRIEALGTPVDSIYFGVQDTSGFLSGNYNGWLGIGFIGYGAITNEMSRFEYCNIEFSAGSGITCVQYPNFEINNSRIANNKEYGLSLFDFSDIVATSILIEYNHQGGIRSNFSAPSISNFIIDSNNGSGISILGNSNTSICTLNSGIIQHNNSAVNGGGIAISEDAMLDLSQIVILYNSALNGAGIYVASGYVTLNQSMISFNQASNGGGMFVGSNSSVIMEFVTVSHNIAEMNGGAVYNENGKLSVTQSTIADNLANEAGGGFYFELYEAGNNLINSSIVWNNTPEAIAVPLLAPEVIYSDIEGGFDGLGNIDDNPLFAQSENNDYHLTWVNFPFENAYTSPCIDRGDLSLPSDPDGTIADIGAYYFHQDLFITKVEESKATGEMEIYPNPATSAITIKCDNEFHSAEIANLNGQIVKRFEDINAGTKHSISDLQPGIYLLMIRDMHGNRLTNKLIKQ